MSTLGDQLRIVAPLAGQGASFQENSRANIRTITHRVSRDVEEHSLDVAGMVRLSLR
jgi:hypothetical protein